jgi:HSP20 family protein
MADDEISKGQGSRVPSRYFDQFHSFRTEMDRLFDSFLGGLPGKIGTRPGQASVPAVDVKETDTGLAVQADLPGVDEKDISLTIQNSILTLRAEKKAERKEERENYHVMERSYGSFERSIRLPDTIDEDNVEARFEKGVLTVTLPKRPEVVKSQKKIEIKSA